MRLARWAARDVARFAAVAAIAGLLGAAPVCGQDEEPQTVIESIRAQLADDCAPYDVEAERWQLLVGELLRLVEPRAGELGMGVPHGEHNRVSDFRLQTDGMGKQWAEWTYVNVGDYDLDGAVDVWDLAPVGSYWLAQPGGDRWCEEAALADGNQDGIVDLQDVAVIAANYGHCVTHYRIASGWGPASLPGDVVRTSLYVPVLATVPVRRSSGYDLHITTRFRVELDLRGRDHYIWAEPVAQLRGAVSEMHYPEGLVARLGADPLSGPVPLRIRFDSLGTTGQGDAPEPEWDYDGDGVFGKSGAEMSGKNVDWYPTVTLDEPYGRLAAVRVTAEDDQQDTAVVPVMAYRAVAWTQLDPQMSSSRRIRLIGGRVALAYLVAGDGGAWQLRYVTAADEDAVAWSEPRVAAELPAEPGSYWLKEIAGRPALAYTLPADDGATVDTHFVSAADEGGRRWNPPVLAAGGLSPADPPPLLAEAGGYPALVHVRQLPASEPDSLPGYEITFRRATDAAGGQWNPLAVIGELEPHEYIERDPTIRSFGPIGGLPTVFLSANVMEGTGHMLLQALDGDGTSWGEIVGVGTTHSCTMQGRDRPVSGLVDLGGAPAYLHNYSWQHFVMSAFGLSVCGPARDRSCALAELPLEPACPFFSGVCGAEPGYSESVFIGQPAAGTVALVAQHSLEDGPVRLRAAVSADGEVWRPTPEFQLQEGASVLATGLLRRTDPAGGAQHDWLQLLLAGETPAGPGLWLTRLPLPDL